MEAVRFALLGPVRAWRGGVEVDLGSPQQRAVLAALLVHEGAQVTVEGLVEGLWGDRAPATAVRVIRQYIHRLRLVLGREGPGHIRSVGGGYALEVDARLCDLTRFNQVVGEARRARVDGDPGLAEGLYAEGLGLWGGPALAGVPGPYAAAQRDRLEELRLGAQEEHLAALVDLGRYDQAALELSVLAGAHPLRERLRELQMLALYGAGRQAEALEAFQAIRALLREELGVDPGPGLRAMHQRILTMDPALLNPAPAPAKQAKQARQARPVPAQLPGDVAHFTGRTDHLEALTELAGRAEATVVVSAIGGSAGIGKSALAVHWAHRHAGLFPDGSLYVNLRGFDPAGPPLDSGAAVRGFLDALGVDSGRIPVGLEAQAGLYRSLLSGKKMLIVLDNARDSDQVRPLLPGAPGTLVLVTSRDRLAGLVALDGAMPLTLDLPSHDEARDLLINRLGPDRVAREQAEVDELIDRCARLPLALTIAAARAALYPNRPLAAFADELRDTRRQLDALTAGEAAADVRTVFSWSYHALTPATARLFRLLGMHPHPGPDITLPAAASLAGYDPGTTRQALDELTRAHLVIEHVPGRYTVHDLLRAYAGEQVHLHDEEAERQAAMRRLLDFYTHTACAAELLLTPHRAPIPLDPPAPGVRLYPLPDASAAMAWYDAEHAVLLTAQQTAAAHSWHRIVWQLACSLLTFHIRRGHRHDQIVVWQAALDATDRLSDPWASMLAHRRLGSAVIEVGRHDEGIAHLHQSLALAEKHGDLDQQAETHRILAWAWEQQHNERQSLKHATATLDLARTLGEPVREAEALNQTGWYLAQLGEFDAAGTHCEAALAILRRHNDPANEAGTLDSLGYIAYHRGHHQQAVEYCQEALAVLAPLGNAFHTADMLETLGHPYAALGQHERARTTWQEALELYRQQGRDQAADRVRQLLDTLDHPRD